MSRIVETFHAREFGGNRNKLSAFFTLAFLSALMIVTSPVAFAADGQGLSKDSRQLKSQPAEPFHIGTFRTKPADHEASTAEPPVGENAVGNNMPRGQSSAVLLEAALLDLKGKKVKSARRLLELLVVRYPNSQESEVARRYLGKLYAGVEPDGREDTQGALKVGTETSSVDTDALLDSNAENVIPKPPPVSDPLSRALGLAVGDRVFFAPGSDKLGTKGVKILRGQAQWLSRRRSLNILVSGYADEPGDEDYNMVLSQKRAISVKDRLIEEGIAKNRIQIIAFGRSSPIAKCAKSVCAAQNRRAVTFILQGPSSHAGLKVNIRKAE